jgi:hypothetical protein
VSYVSNVVLHIDDSDALRDELEHAGLVRMEERSWGGTKYFEDDLYLAAFNYLDVEQFVAWFHALPWKDESAVLSICSEAEEWWHCFRDGRYVSSRRVESGG